MVVEKDNTCEHKTKLQVINQQLKAMNQQLAFDEQKLRESHQQLLDIIDFLPDATFVIDEDRKIVAWNRALEKMTGVTKDKMIGKGDLAYSVPFYGKKRPILVDLLGMEDKEIEEKYDYVERTGKIVKSQVFIPSLYQGKGAHVLITTAPLLNQQGRRVGAIESICDVTKRKQAEETIENYNQQLILQEQQLRASNQQLVANEQQLKAANQQLAANEQQLKATNQQLRANEQELLKSRQLYKSIFDGSIAGLAVYDVIDEGADFIIKEFNSAAEEIESLSRKDIIGKSILEVFPGVIEFGLFDVLKRVYKTGKSEHFPISLYQDDRNSSWRESYVFKLQSGEVVSSYRDVTEHKIAEDARREYIQFLESLGKIDQVIQASTSHDEMLNKITETLLNMFKCDRVWLLPICELKAPSLNIPFFSSRPEFVVDKDILLAVPNITPIREAMVDALASNNPITYGEGNEKPVSVDIHKEYNVKSQLIMSIHPKTGDPWLFGMHQCSDTRVWTDQEKRLFNEISRRVTDGLSSLLFLRDLENSRETYRITVEKTGHVFYDYDPVSGTIKWDGAVEEVTGYTQEEFYLIDIDGWGDLIHPDDRDLVLTELKKSQQKCSSFDFEYRLRHKDGNYIYIEDNGSFLQDNKGCACRMLGAMKDVTKRKQAEKALEFQAMLLDQIQDQVIATDLDGTITYVNDGVAKRLLRKKQELIGNKITILGESPDFGATQKEILDKTLSQGQWHGEVANVTSDGKEVLLDCKTYSVYNPGGKLTGLCSVSRDITQVKQHEKQMMRYQRQLRDLTSQLTTAEEQERRRISTMLHDEITQKLVLFKIKLGLYRDKEMSQDLKNSCEEMYCLIDEMIHDSRDLIFDLSCPTLYELGLEAAIKQLLESEIEQNYGIVTKYVNLGNSNLLEENLRAVLYRSIKELLYNVVKHAHARKVKVSICKSSDKVSVSVIDDGVGFESTTFDTDNTQTHGFGLFSIKERLEQLGGAFEIESEQGHGSKVSLTVPCNNNTKITK